MSASNPGPRAPVLPRRLARRRRQSPRRAEPALRADPGRGARWRCAERPAAARREDRPRARASTARSPSSAPATCARPRSTSCAARPRRRRCSCATSSPSLDTRRQGRQDHQRRARSSTSSTATGLATLREIGAAVDRFQGQRQEGRRLGLELRPAPVLHRRPCRRGLPASAAGRGQRRPASAACRTTTRTRSTSSASASTCVRAGTFKDFGEAYRRQRSLRPSARGRKRAARLAVEDLHRRDREAAEARARLGDERRSTRRRRGCQAVAAATTRQARARRARRSTALKTRDELRALMISRGVEDAEHKTRSARPRSTNTWRASGRASSGDAIGVVVAEGEIVDGTGAGRHDRRPLDRQPDQEGARRQGREGGRPARQFARRQRLRLGAGAPRARADARRRQARGRVAWATSRRRAATGSRPRPTRSSPTRATVTGSIGVIALLPNFAGTLDKLGVHSSPLATTGCAAPTTPRVPLDPRLADMIQQQRRPRIPDVHRPGRAGAQDHAGRRSTRSPLGPGLVRRAGAASAARSTGSACIGDALTLGSGAGQARRRSAHHLHRARAGQRSRASSRCSMPKWRARFSASIDARS